MNKKVNPRGIISHHSPANITRGKNKDFPTTQDLSHRGIECRTTFGSGFFLRHGESERLEKGLPDGEKDGPLTDKGISQMEKSTETLSAYLPTFVEVLVAPRERNRQSAEIIQRELLKHNIFVVKVTECELLTQEHFAEFTEDIWQRLPPSVHTRLVITAEPCITQYATALGNQSFMPHYGDAFTQNGQIIYCDPEGEQ